MFIERLWRSVKHEDIYLREYASLPALEAGLGAWFERYTAWRPNEALGNRTPQKAFSRSLAEKRGPPQLARAAYSHSFLQDASTYLRRAKQKNRPEILILSIGRLFLKRPKLSGR